MWLVGTHALRLLLLLRQPIEFGLAKLGILFRIAHRSIDVLILIDVELNSGYRGRTCRHVMLLFLITHE